MDLTSLFILATIITITSFIVKTLIGFNLKKILGELAIIPFVLPVLFFLTSPPHNVEATTSFLDWYINMFADALPGMIVGEIVGSFAAAVTKGFKNVT